MWRVGGSIGTTGAPLAELVRPISSGTNTTALTVHQVPASSPYLYGETYFSSLKYALPSGTLSGAETENLPAALRFPSLINYTANSGLGFSPIAEAYWNFGLVGAFLVPVFIGSVMRWCYARSRAFAMTPLHLLYAITLARVPIALRSDFLQQYKGVLIALTLITIVWYVDRIIAGRHVGPEVPDEIRSADLSSDLNEANP
ncbi:O-antigen polysaccharide polymerase Wzy family protein [Janibacter limosus]|uniref:O-antigen polysaccharide polymerase Wzy family protein n=1 Tax=Janibacter limosus TaxID=53458 RepID=A0AC61U8U9_9MICO|nr:O-antigen polysaccharide polymerase Wzy family protein [Janibacter limosus]UUZ46268.1 O-antigen polysaccharide polymerase Wzy family protein [Janibacter limosus]